MMVYSNAIIPRNSNNTVYSPVRAQLPGGQAEEYAFIWCPTARTLETSPIDESNRNSTTCYIRGLKEKVQLNMVTGKPWQWRRIVFFAKGLADGYIQDESSRLWLETSNGYRRIVNEMDGTNKLDMYGNVFRGDKDIDWSKPINAPVDTRRVTVAYDKIRTISSGTDRGALRTFNMWHPVNKNLVYDDDESGNSMISNAVSVRSKAGCGDMFVLDIFDVAGGSSSGDILEFLPNATLYWHEK